MLNTTTRPSTSAAANWLSRTTTLSVVTLKQPDSTARGEAGLVSVRFNGAYFTVRYAKTSEKPSRTQNQVSWTAVMAAVVRQDRCCSPISFQHQWPPWLRPAAP